jgi:hypothetical protein
LGKSDDDLGELTFEVGLFFCSVCASRTVRAARVCQVFFAFLLTFRFDLSWF